MGKISNDKETGNIIEKAIYYSIIGKKGIKP